jgi:hypothetical protein
MVHTRLNGTKQQFEVTVFVLGKLGGAIVMSMLAALKVASSSVRWRDVSLGFAEERPLR